MGHIRASAGDADVLNPKYLGTRGLRQYSIVALLLRLFYSGGSKACKAAMSNGMPGPMDEVR